MGNTCCRKPDEDVLNTIESQDKDEVIKDKYPHDSDSAFRLLKQQQDKNYKDIIIIYESKFFAVLFYNTILPR